MLTWKTENDCFYLDFIIQSAIAGGFFFFRASERYPTYGDLMRIVTFVSHLTAALYLAHQVQEDRQRKDG